MKIKSIKLHHIAIPFSTSIGHSLKKRARSASIVLAVYDDQGNVGYGEGAPRVYVTGKSIKEVMTSGKAILDCGIDQTFESLDSIKHFCKALSIWVDFPSIITAFEIALLDLLGQNQQCSMGKFIENNNTFTPIYSAILPFLPYEKLIKWLGIIQQLELKQLKVKVGQADDEKHLKLIRKSLGDTIDIRLDANRAWNLDEAITNIRRLETYNISGIEEPLVAEQITQLPYLARKISTPLILDESVFTMEHAQYFAKFIPANQLIYNLKISKSGGILATSDLHQYASSKGIECQLGCNVGETAILSAVGRHFAQTHALKYLEGSYAPFFMEDDISAKPISFSKAGQTQKLTAPGLGIQIDQEKLTRFSQSSICLN